MFAKVFVQMFDSSLADDPYVRHFFVDLLVLADKDGIVDMTHSALAARTRLPKGDVIRWIEALERPDPDSRTPDHEGRRLIKLDNHRTWGWKIVNFTKYRESATREMLRMVEADRKREWRRRNGKTRPPLPHTPSLNTEEEGEADRSLDSPGHVPDTSRTGKAQTPPSSACASEGNNGSLTTAERISLEKEADRIRRWLKSHAQDSYTTAERAARTCKLDRLSKIEDATRIKL